MCLVCILGVLDGSDSWTNFCTGIPVLSQVLMYSGHPLKDTESLAHYGIQQQSTLQLVMRQHHHSEAQSPQPSKEAQSVSSSRGKQQDRGSSVAAEKTSHAAQLLVQVWFARTMPQNKLKKVFLTLMSGIFTWVTWQVYISAMWGELAQTFCLLDDNTNHNTKVIYHSIAPPDLPQTTKIIHKTYEIPGSGATRTWALVGCTQRICVHCFDQLGCRAMAT